MERVPKVFNRQGRREGMNYCSDCKLLKEGKCSGGQLLCEMWDGLDNPETGVKNEVDN